METYKISTEVFEGPLELLLALIEKRKLLINDISLTEVADNYLKYLEKHKEFPVSETAQFVLVGSTLLLIKSKSLLPTLSLTSEEQGSIEDLEARLKILDRYKSFARILLAEYNKQPLHARRHTKNKRPTFSPDKSMTVDGLHQAVQSVLALLPKQKPKLSQAIVEKVISLEEMMDQLSSRISSAMQVSFRDFSDGSGGGRVNVIVSFLAMLELVHQGVIRVEQANEHGEITMSTDSVELPKYG